MQVKKIYKQIIGQFKTFEHNMHENEKSIFDKKKRRKPFHLKSQHFDKAYLMSTEFVWFQKDHGTLEKEKFLLLIQNISRLIF